jgi:hypothetical protein
VIFDKMLDDPAASGALARLMDEAAPNRLPT